MEYPNGTFAAGPSKVIVSTSSSLVPVEQRLL